MSYKKVLFILFIIMSSVFLCFNSIYEVNVSSPFKGQIDLFQKVLDNTEGEYLEQGIIITFNKEVYRDMSYQELEKVLKEQLIYSEIINKESEGIEFQNKYLKGTIKEQAEEFTLNIIFPYKQEYEEVKAMADSIISTFKNRYKDLSYSQYMKIALKGDDTKFYADIIEGLLNKLGSKNLKQININCGISGTALTGIYRPISVNNQDIDFNYAICKYESGTYMIIGTPVISCAY